MNLENIYNDNFAYRSNLELFSHNLVFMPFGLYMVTFYYPVYMYVCVRGGGGMWYGRVLLWREFVGFARIFVKPALGFLTLLGFLCSYESIVSMYLQQLSNSYSQEYFPKIPFFLFLVSVCDCLCERAEFGETWTICVGELIARITSCRQMETHSARGGEYYPQRGRKPR